MRRSKHFGRPNDLLDFSQRLVFVSVVRTLTFVSRLWSRGKTIPNQNNFKIGRYNGQNVISHGFETFESCKNFPK